VEAAQMALVWESILRMLSLLPQGIPRIAVLTLKWSTKWDSFIPFSGGPRDD
jgi:hypothetical protein